MSRGVSMVYGVEARTHAQVQSARSITALRNLRTGACVLSALPNCAGYACANAQLNGELPGVVQGEYG